MIIIGSYAAQLGGFTPPWRDRGPNDVDIACRPADVAALALLTGAEPLQSTANTSFLIVGRMPLELMLLPLDIVETIEQLSGAPQPVQIGLYIIEAQIAPVEVIWATLAFTAGLNRFAYRKSFRDLFAYEGIARPDDRHRQLALRFREEMVRRIQRRLEEDQ